MLPACITCIVRTRGLGLKLACGGAMGFALLRLVSKQRRVPGPRFVATRAWQQPLSGKLPEPLRATDGRQASREGRREQGGAGPAGRVGEQIMRIFTVPSLRSQAWCSARGRLHA